MNRLLIILAAAVALFAACASLPPSMGEVPTCSVDADCAVPADCRSYSCSSEGKCILAFEPGKPSTCGPECGSDDDCGKDLKCLEGGLCGCDVDDDCGSTDCMASACMDHVCVQSMLLEHGDNCPPSANAAPMCKTANDCAGMEAVDPAPPCYIWTCVGEVGMCEKAPITEGTPCASSAPICAGTCTFEPGSKVEICKPDLSTCADGGASD